MIKHNAEPIHVIVTCVACGAVFDHYETALREAKQHADSTGHTLKGEAAYLVEITPTILAARPK